MLSCIDHTQSGLGAVPMGVGGVCPHALGTPHCPQHCCLGVGTHHDLPLAHVALGEAMPHPVPFLPTLLP